MEDIVKPYFLDRILAKLIDLIIVGIFFAFPTFIGTVAGITYILIADGLNGGQSLGKRIIRLKVVSPGRGWDDCNFQESILRNIPVGVVILFTMIPYLRWLLFFTLGLAIVAFETYLSYVDDEGLRWGDRIALTQVVTQSKNP